MPSEDIDTENQLGVEVYCSIQSRPLAIDFDNGLAYSDPLRLRLRWVGNVVSYSMYPLKDCLMRPLPFALAPNIQHLPCLTSL